MILIKTADKALSGTDANVTLALNCTRGHTLSFSLLTPNIDLFERNQLDAFFIETPNDIGEPMEIKCV